MHIYIYICVCVYVCVCVCVCENVCKVYMYVIARARVYVCMQACMHACIYMCDVMKYNVMYVKCKIYVFICVMFLHACVQACCVCMYMIIMRNGLYIYIYWQMFRLRVRGLNRRRIPLELHPSFDSSQGLHKDFLWVIGSGAPVSEYKLP